MALNSLAPGLLGVCTEFAEPGLLKRHGGVVEAEGFLLGKSDTEDPLWGAEVGLAFACRVVVDILCFLFEKVMEIKQKEVKLG